MSDMILRAAINEFAQKGMKATLSAIAEQADVPESALYRHYPNKEALIIALTDHFWDKMLDSFRIINSVNWYHSEVEKLLKLAELIQMALYKDLNLVKVVASGYLPNPEKIDDEALREKRLEIRRKNREALRMIDVIIKDGQDKGEIILLLKPQVIRQILIGAFQALGYGLFIQFDRNEDVGYEPMEARKGLEFVIDSIRIRE